MFALTTLGNFPQGLLTGLLSSQNSHPTHNPFCHGAKIQTRNEKTSEIITLSRRISKIYIITKKKNVMSVVACT